MAAKFQGMSTEGVAPYLKSLEKKRMLLMQSQSGSTRQNDASSAREQGIGDVVDQAKTSTNEEMDILLLGNTCQTLERVELAISKARDGMYGVCQRCEGKISKTRLQAMPEAEYCMPCQEKAEAQDQHLERRHAVDFSLDLDR